MAVPPEHQRFADQVAAAKQQDPMPTFANLSAATGVPVEDLVHYALVRWAASGSEASQRPSRPGAAPGRRRGEAATCPPSSRG